MLRTFPPIEFDNLREAEIGNQIGDMARNDNCRRFSPRTQIVVHDRAQRGPMQMIEVRVRHQHRIDGWQIAHTNAGTPQSLQHKQPAGKVGIDHHALPADLKKKTGMPDERNSQFALRCQARLVSFATERGYRGVAHQSAELRCAFAESRILKRCLDHPRRACFIG